MHKAISTLSRTTQIVPGTVFIEMGKPSGSMKLEATSLHPLLLDATIEKITFFVLNALPKESILCRDLRGPTPFITAGQVPLQFVEENWDRVLIKPGHTLNISLMRATRDRSEDVIVSVSMLTKITYLDESGIPKEAVS